MRLQLLLILAAALPVNSFCEPESNQALQLEQLLSAVQANIPDGWTAEIWPTKKRGPVFTRQNYYYSKIIDTPRLIVYRNSKAPAHSTIVFGNPGAVGKDEGSPKQLATLEEAIFHFFSRPFITQKEFGQIKKENDIKSNARSEFEKKLNGMRYSHMGPRPFPPAAYKPQTDAERHLSREYAFLWMNTIPRQLPAFYYGRLAFGDTYLHLAFTQPEVQQEVSAVRKSIEKILTRYN